MQTEDFTRRQLRRRTSFGDANIGIHVRPIALEERVGPWTAYSSAARNARPEESGAAMVEHLKTLDSALHLDCVIHDFMACLERGDVRDGAQGEGPSSVARFMRILEYTPTTNSPVLGPPVLCGVSPPIGIESVLGFLGSQRQTGILRIRTDDAMFMISVVRGDVVHGVSNPRPESELLGNILVERGAIDGADLGRFFEKCGSSAFKMGEALNRQELVNTDVLREALKQQVQKLFDRLLTTGYSEWCFHEGEATLSYINLRMNLTSVLLESARKHDEESRAEAGARAAVDEGVAVED